MLVVWADLIFKKASLLPIEDSIDGGATCSTARWIPCLNNEVALDIVEDAVVVVLDPAQEKKRKPLITNYVVQTASFRQYQEGKNKRKKGKTQTRRQLAYLQSLRKFLLAKGVSSKRSTVISPLLVSRITDPIALVTLGNFLFRNDQRGILRQCKFPRTTIKSSIFDSLALHSVLYFQVACMHARNSSLV